MKIKTFLTALILICIGTAIAPAQFRSSQTYIRPVHMPQLRTEQVDIPLANGNRFNGNRETVDGAINRYSGTFYYADGAKIICSNFDANFCIPNNVVFWFATADGNTVYKRQFQNGVQVDLSVYNVAGQSWMISGGNIQFLNSGGGSYDYSGGSNYNSGGSYNSGSSSSGSSSSSRVQCPSCHGAKVCSHCGGQGRLKSNIVGQGYYTCSVCNGRKTCSYCNGRGTVR